jgi:hypothetical protein
VQLNREPKAIERAIESGKTMDPVTMGLLKLGVSIMKNSAVVDNVNNATRFFLTFDKNGDKELDADEIAAALEVVSLELVMMQQIVLTPPADAEGCEDTRGFEPSITLSFSRNSFKKMGRKSCSHRSKYVKEVLQRATHNLHS